MSISANRHTRVRDFATEPAPASQLMLRFRAHRLDPGPRRFPSPRLRVSASPRHWMTVAKRALPRAACSGCLMTAVAVLLYLPATLLADEPASMKAALRDWLVDLLQEVKSPLFWFGMAAQLTFFMRFIVQWIVSEKRRRSTVPVAFWYFSLVGGLSLFIYACLKRDPVIMSGQLLACVIYVRNLMLIRDWRTRRKRAGLPIDSGDE